MTDRPRVKVVELHRYVFERPVVERHEFQVLLTRKQVAEMLQVHPSTIDRWVEDNKLPVIKHGDFVRFLLADVNDFIQRNRRVA